MLYTPRMQALLYDVHGNLPALDAVLADAAAAGPDRYVLGGDYALFGGWPRETLARLRELPEPLWIRGNGERWTAHPGAAPEDPVVQGAIAAAREALGEMAVLALDALPSDARRGDTLFCHASPASDVDSFLPEPADDETALLEGVTARRLVFGHTHLPFRRGANGIQLVNPGSVGMPFDGDPRAAYALIHDDGTLEHRRVVYDHELSAARVRALGGWGRTVALRIEQARMDAS
jgi:diadenosine tetraphosphatase ApaH/serine/threonine PP2A family protein phosphatase